MSQKNKIFCRFTRELDEKLIELVSKNEVLYNSGHKFYKDITVRDDVWLAISTIVGKSVSDCKTRWRSLRDLYHRKKKDERKGKRKRNCWEYMDVLSFLDEFVTEKKPTLEESSDEKEEDIKPCIYFPVLPQEAEVSGTRPTSSSQNDDDVATPVPVKKIKVEKIDSYQHQIQESNATLQLLKEIRDATKSNQHPIMTFFESMAKTVMAFPPALAAEAKLKVCQVVTEIECRILDETGNYPEHFTHFD